MTSPLTGDPIADALDTLLDLDALTAIAALARKAIHVAEVAPLFEQDALRHDRTAGWHADHGRYDLAAGEREAARIQPATLARINEPHARELIAQVIQ